MSFLNRWKRLRRSQKREKLGVGGTKTKEKRMESGMTFRS